MITLRKEAILTWIGVAGMWILGGAIYPVMSDVTKTVAPLNLVFYRTFGSGIALLLILLLFQRSQLALLRFDRRLIPIICASLLFNPICASALAWSSTKIPGAISALLYGTLPAMATIYGAIIGKRPHRLAIMGVVIATIAVVFLVGSPSGSTNPSGIYAALFSTLAWFAATEVWITFNPGYPLLISTSVQIWIGAIGCLLVRPVLKTPALDLHQFLIPGVIFLTASFAIQHFMYLGISSRVSPQVLTSFGFVNPLVAMIVGYAVYSQKITAVQGVAGVILLIGVGLVVKET